MKLQAKMASMDDQYSKAKKSPRVIGRGKSL
jgi:hypothetical protein